jgi:diguanylate cyclase (GGDEF)-like protein
MRSQLELADGAAALNQLLRRGRLPLVWAVAAGALLLLGFFRSVTDAQFALASAVIIPVCLVAWAGGFAHGVAASILAALMWWISGLSAIPLHGTPWILLLNGLTRLLTYLFVAYLIARVRMLLVQESERARRDMLTGVLNRRAFHEAGYMEAQRATRYQHPFAVMFIDLDRFKQLNDSRGHVAGDQALAAVSQALSRALRVTDCIARLGGDEFGVILPEIDWTGAVAAEDKLSAEVALALRDFAPVSASIGIAWFERACPDFEYMLRAADALMYRIKGDGAGGVCMQHYPIADPRQAVTAERLSSPTEIRRQSNVRTLSSGMP